MQDQRPTTTERGEAGSFGELQRALHYIYDDFSWLDLDETSDEGAERAPPRLAPPGFSAEMH